MYFYYQIEGKEAAWREALAAQRESIVEQKRPRYTTVLELDTLILDTHSREDVSKVKYRGPFYIDWDAPDIDTAIARVRQFMGKLTEQDVDLDSIALTPATRKRRYRNARVLQDFASRPAENDH